MKKSLSSNTKSINYEKIQLLSKQYGNSFFILDGNRFSQNFTSLHGEFRKYYKNVEIGYSYKTNYTPQLCHIVQELGGYAEIVSEMEYVHAKRLCIPPNRIIFNGPVKARWAFEEAALTGATINLDSMNDLGMLKSIALANPNNIISVVIRINFPIGKNISRFGMDANGEEFFTTISTIKEIPNISLKGFHCHFPDRSLDSFKRRANGMIKVVRRVFGEKPPEIINIGGGYFSHMPESLHAKFDIPPATFKDYGKTIGNILSKEFQGVRMPTLFLEPGTALVADAQVFYTRIISVKNVRGKYFATVAGSSFDISPTARSRNLPVTVIPKNESLHEVDHDIVGFTCIEGDILTENLVTPLLQPDDFLCYSNVGSYSVVMRPPFILPANPVLFDSGNGELTLIKHRQSNEDVFRDFIY